MPSEVRHSFFVATQADPSAAGSPTETQTIFPWFVVSDQKSTPFTPFTFCFNSIPSGMTSPWQNQADF